MEIADEAEGRREEHPFVIILRQRRSVQLDPNVRSTTEVVPSDSTFSPIADVFYLSGYAVAIDVPWEA